MNIRELVELANNNKNKMLKGEQFLQFLEKTLNVKKYISIKEKKLLIEDIINDCILYEDGIFKFDNIDKYITFTMRTIAAYTDLELSADMESDYDSLCSAKLLNAVIETFSGEYENVNLLLQMRCEQILYGNSTEAQFGKFLTSLSDGVDKLTDSLSAKIDKFDIKNLPINMEDIGKIMEFFNSQKK